MKKKLRKKAIRLNKPVSTYRYGGMPGYGAPKKYLGGGMYDENTVQAAGQGNVGSTANTVYQENNPALQNQRLEALDTATQTAIEQAEGTATEANKIQEEGDQQASLAAQTTKDNYLAQEEAFANTAKMGYDAVNKARSFDGTAATTSGGTVASTSVGALNAGSQAIGKGFAQKTGQVVAKDLSTSLIRNQGAKTIGGGVAKGTMSGASLIGEGAKAGGKMAGFGGAGVGTGLGKFASSGAGIGTIAALAGAGISKWSDDGDATKSNFGEYSGSVLSSAGTGASIGSLVGPVGTLVGGIAGGIYGGVKQLFGTNKAKREEEKVKKEFKKKQTAGIVKGNTELMKNYGTHLSQASAGNIKQKTYAGYDLGRNVTAKRGGYRNMPQYI